ncbi:cytochrome b [Motilimonas sp. E26]|uniref:cytochrome b n=1 Tax=Motilimonas sp. E26 TaxID=2865674 RepID=UPI001E4C8EDF|nr:cytochrome b [Motilimonas sp. E26]MCE0557266.1 cytochrome b [Motilimonas sp. E26]
MLKNSTQGYGWVTIIIHWLVALAVFSLFALGYWMVDLSYYSDWYQTAPMLHKSFGICLFALMVFRIIWRLTNPKPKGLSNHQTWEKTIAKLGHFALYAILFVLMISGYLISTADGRAISVFGWFDVPALLSGLPQQEEIAGDIHEILAWSLLVLSAGHALAALKHHFIDKDSTLSRMLKPVNSTETRKQ